MKRFILILTILLVFFLNLTYQPASKAKTTNTLSEANESVELFPIKQNGKWGYIDKIGQIIIEPKYLAAQPFSDSLAFVRTAKHLKAIDSLGNTVFKLPLASNFPGAYSEGLAPFLVDGKYGFIDKNGKTILDFKYDFAAPFSDGLALIKIGDKYGFIDKDGKTVIEPQFSSATSFSDGLVAVRFSKTDQQPIFMDKDGEMTIYIPNYLNKNFVKKPIPTTNQINDIINSYSNLSTGFNAKIAFDSRAFSENLISVKINNQYGYINKEGKIVIEPQFSYADAFSNGLAQISLRGKCAFVNESGTIVINTPYHYYSCSRFSSGLAKIQTNGQVGYIDKNGHFIWPLTN
ncbi:MAG: WG repeat-containing protein [Acidobacteria bacterium]|nr:WG repeat-containing protein [Acidobacteriota bacterium]